MKKLGNFLNKAKGFLADKGRDAGQLAIAAATGDFKGVIKEVGDILGADLSEEGKALSEEFKLKLKEFELEYAKMESADRDSARKREVGVAEAGGDDIMMIVTGSVGLFSFLLVVVTVLFLNLPKDNKELVYHLLGIIEGVAIGMFTYYYGSSKGSSDKQKELMKK